MQNRYAGDVGDFMKLGLLRYVAASPSDGGTGLMMGLNWYLAPDEGHNADGKHTTYLHPRNRHHYGLRACDPELMRCLARVVVHDRSVRALEECGALPRALPPMRRCSSRRAAPEDVGSGIVAPWSSSQR